MNKCFLCGNECESCKIMINSYNFRWEYICERCYGIPFGKKSNTPMSCKSCTHSRGSECLKFNTQLRKHKDSNEFRPHKDCQWRYYKMRRTSDGLLDSDMQ